MTSVLLSALKSLLSLLKYFLYLLIPVAIAIIILILCLIYHYFKHRYIEHIKPKKRHNNYYFTYKNNNYVIERPYEDNRDKTNILKKIFYEFPKQLTYDYLEQDPNAFGEFGIHIVVGEQGAGKTVTVVYLLRKWQKEYPRLKIYTNMEYKYENGQLEYWQDLLEHPNGIYGKVNVIDEIKTWWSNLESKDVPPEILGEICQQRKQKTATVGTVQVFGELAKPFRSQTHFVYVPRTILGCFTIVFKSKAKYYDMEKNTFKKYCGFFVFVHNKEIREAYDTFKKIQKYKNKEFAVSEYFKPVGEPVAMQRDPQVEKEKAKLFKFGRK